MVKILRYALALLIPGLLPLACSEDAIYIDKTVPSASSSGSGGAGEGGGAAQAGGGAAPSVGECATAADCPGPADPICGAAECVEGSCKLTIKLGPLVSQIRGDCKRRDCDVTGKVITLDDPGDWYDDGKECTLDYCEASERKNEAVWDGFGCPETGAGVCFDGSCVECIKSIAEVCGNGFYCDYFNCVPMMCDPKNGMVDPGLETGVDCGGLCYPCFNPQTCKEGSDCFHGVCVSGTCALPTHSDGVRNDDEVGIDCGCLSCALCADGFDCEVGENCASHVCWAGKCEAPRCDDGIKNGVEDGIDCGGPCSACL